MQQDKELKTTDSRDRYLTSIYLLSRHLDNVRSVDIAVYQGVSKAAVSMKIRELKSQGFIRVDSNRITLTSSGKGIAERINRNYKTLKNFLKSNGIHDSGADEIASVSAGLISSETFECLKMQISLKQNPGEELPA